MSQSRVFRRKACELCTTKKIKCNYDLPVCANCISYGVECKNVASSAKAKTRAKRRAIRNTQNVPPESDDKHTNIERKLEEILSNLRPSASPSSETSSNTTEWTQSLPPLEDIRPAIDNFFRRLNTKLPFFNESSFMRRVAACYSQPSKGNQAALCATLVAAALGFTIGPDCAVVKPDEKRRGVLQRMVQSIECFVLGVMAEHDDLLIVQVSAALSCYFNCTGNFRKANIYIGMAMRLAFQLQLHTKPPPLQFSPEEAEERIWAFWSMYLLEKEISFRLRQPSMQPESEINVPLPSADSQDSQNPGPVVFVDDANLNVFRLRIKLGRVKDQVYHLLYSNQAVKMQEACQKRNIPGPEEQLEHWFQQIPTEFHMPNLRTVTEPIGRDQLFRLHLEYFSIFIAAHGAMSPNADWVQGLSSLGKIALEESAVSLFGRHKADSVKKLKPPSTEAWARCVELGQQCIGNFSWAIEADASIWRYGEVFCSAMIFVLADSLQPWPSQPPSEMIQEEIFKALSLLDSSEYDEVYKTHTQHMRLVVQELRQKRNRHRQLQDFVNQDAWGQRLNIDTQPAGEQLQGDEVLVDMQGWAEISAEDLFLSIGP